MHLDLSDGGPPLFQTKVCIVGAGAAGITLARALTRSGQDVILLESGGLDYEGSSAELNVGINVGEDYYDLKHARLRFFGGTTAIWGGRCAELDPIDFERRSWVPHSGWPIPYDEISPYYERARQVFGLAPEPSFDQLGAAAIDFPRFDETLIQPRLWSFDDMFNRFTFEHCRDLRDDPRCTIITHATVSEIVAAPDGNSIESVTIRDRGGRKRQVMAQSYVLAAGGIENPRLLLASRGILPAGIGNGHDQVGRYFMEHPHARGGHVTSMDVWRLLALFDRRHRVGAHSYAALLTPGARLQKQEGLLNTSLTIGARRPAYGTEALAIRAYKHLKHQVPPGRLGRSLWMYTKKVTGWAQRKVDPFRPWCLHRLGILDLALIVRAEQAPNPDSRVTLADETDALGMPRVKLDWRTQAIDVHSVRGLVAALDREFERMGIGQIQPAEWLLGGSPRWTSDPLISMHPIGGYHHMGTTRMSDSPAHGVTDRHGRVHGIANLYVAGSSLFPTGGWANPTLTIVALALRTADTLSRLA